MKPPKSYTGPIPWEDLCTREEYLCSEDRYWLFERHFVIKDKQGRLKLLSPLRLAQRKTLAIIQMLRVAKLPVRVIIGKSRKQGLSTIIEADMLAEVLSKQIDGLVITHEVKLSEKLFDMTRRYFDYLDKPLTPGITPLQKPHLYKGVTNKQEMRFQGHDGKIWVETAGNKYAGTGQTPQYGHLSEMSKWDKGAEVAVSLFQSIASLPETTVIIESTFNGYDGLFLPHWEGAYNNCRVWFTEEPNDMGAPELRAHYEVTNPKEWNHFIPLFISVLDDEDALLAFQDDTERDRFAQTLNDYEKMLVERGASLEHLNWRRMQLKLTCQGDEDIMRQEYPSTPGEAVRASGRGRFDQRRLDMMPIEDGEVGELYYSDRWDKQVLFRRDAGGALTRFKQPVRGHRYVIGVDSAEGRLDAHGRKQDDSVVDVYDLDMGMEQVAVLCDNISVENLVAPVLMIAEYYNNAFIAPEANSIGHHLCIELLKKYPKERLYHRQDDHGRNREVGFKTTVGTKESILIGGLAAAIADGQIIFHYKKTLEQLRVYVKKAGGGTEAEAGYHDDLVIGAALAVVGAKAYPPTLNRSKMRTLASIYNPQHRDDGRNAITGY